MIEATAIGNCNCPQCANCGQMEILPKADAQISKGIVVMEGNILSSFLGNLLRLGS